MSRAGARSAESPPHPEPAAQRRIRSGRAVFKIWKGSSPARASRSACILIFQGHADEYGHAEIVVVEKGAKAAFAIPRPDQPQLIGEESRPPPQTAVVPRTHVNLAADEVQAQQGHELQHRDDVAIRIAEHD